jgi:hypothetical protein
MPTERKKRTAKHQTRAQRWKKPDTRELEITLPSDNDAVIRMMALDEMLIVGGSVFGVHAATVMQFMEKLEKSKPAWLDGDPKELAPEQLSFVFGFLGDMRALADPVCRMVFVSPRIVEADADPDEDEITLDDLTEADRMFVIGRVMGVDDILMSFFPPSDGGVDAGPGGGEVPHEAEPDPEG